MLNPELREPSELPTPIYEMPGVMTGELPQQKLDHPQHELTEFWVGLSTTPTRTLCQNHPVFTSGTEFSSISTCILVPVSYDQPCSTLRSIRQKTHFSVS